MSIIYEYFIYNSKLCVLRINKLYLSRIIIS